MDMPHNIAIFPRIKHRVEGLQIWLRSYVASRAPTGLSGREKATKLRKQCCSASIFIDRIPYVFGPLSRYRLWCLYCRLSLLSFVINVVCLYCR